MATARKTKVKREFATMSDGTRYALSGRGGGWVRLSLKRHEEKDADGRNHVNPNGTIYFNNASHRRIRKQLSK